MAKHNPQNPYTRDQTATRADVPLPVQRATVIDAQDNGLHRATVQIYGTSTTENATVLAPMYGSVWVPEEGTDVLVLYGADDTPYIIGSWYAEDRVEGGYVDVPDYSAGDLRLGNNTGSHVTVGADGDVRIGTADGDFLIDDDKIKKQKYTDEDAQDAIASALVGGVNTSILYDDGDDTITIDTSSITAEDVEDIVASLVTGGAGISATYDDANDELLLDGFGGSHTDLSDIASDQHHTRYTDTEALDVVGDSDNDVNIGVQDTRDQNESPTFFNKEVSYDFKSTSAIGVPSSGEYCGVMTFAPWSNNSGDKSHQLAYTNDGLFFRNAFPDSSSWEPWTKVGNENKAFLVEGSNTNINQSTTVSWNNTTFNDSPYSWDGSSQLTIEKAGRYEIHAEADFASGGNTRQNPNLFIHQNGSIVGVGGRSGYVRDREGHNHSSVHSHAVINANAGDVIDVGSRAEADASGSVTPSRAMFYVKRIESSDTPSRTLGYFDGNVTTTQTNAENGLYVNVAESVNENDGWTVNNDSQISPEESGTYKIESSVNFHRTGSGSRNIMYAELEVNGTRLSQRTRGVCYIRNNVNGGEGDATFSTIIDLNAGDTIHVFAGEERGAETGNDVERASINIQKIQ